MARVKGTRADASVAGDLAAVAAGASGFPAAPAVEEPPPPTTRARSPRRKSPRTKLQSMPSQAASLAGQPATIRPQTSPPPPQERPLPPRQTRPHPPPHRLVASTRRGHPTPPATGRLGSHLGQPRPSSRMGRPYPATTGATSVAAAPIFVVPPGSAHATRQPPQPARRLGRTNGRMGFVLDIDPHAARRSVEMPENCPSINRMSVFNEPALGISNADKKHLRLLTSRAIEYCQKDRPFCQQARHVIAGAITYLELHEPRLALCVRSWGSCSLLSKRVNNAYEHHRRMDARRLAAGEPPAAAPPPQAPPAQTPALAPQVAHGDTAALATAQRNFFATIA